MPLPGNGAPWPPKTLEPIHARMHELATWWAGDTDALEATYARTANAVRPSQLAGGVVGAVARFWWGRPTPTGGQASRKLHIPIAADLCQASADLLFAETPSVTVDNVAVNTRLAALFDDRAVGVLASAAEAGAALGDWYVAVAWDKTIDPDKPFLVAVDADAVAPEFRFGRLVAATVWHVVRQDGQQVWRHLERHELDADGNGLILHGLYLGSSTSLGMAVPLTEDPATAGLQVDAEGAVVGPRTPGLGIVHVPNQTPQREWRNHATGRHLGRSDLDQLPPLMDALDEAWSSWMRDIRLGKARLLVPESALTDLGPGQGAGFDTDREIFTPLNTPPSSVASSQAMAQASQFQIRFAEHAATCHELLATILRTAGYSPGTFGQDEGGRTVAVTATEIRARQQRSFSTRDRKIRNTKGPLAELLLKLLHVDRAVFGTSITPELPDVDFPDGIQEPMLTLAQTATALRSAEAASTRIIVGLVHPDWDEPQIDAEVAAIEAERDAAKPDPLPDPTSPTIVPGTDPSVPPDRTVPPADVPAEQ